MLVHIVMLQLKEKLSPEDFQQSQKHLKHRLDELPQHIVELLHMEVGLNISKRSTAYDLVLTTKFNDLNDLEIYRTHPEHLKVLDVIQQYVEATAVVDYYV